MSAGEIIDFMLPSGWRTQSLSAFTTNRPGTINPASHPDETFEYYSIPAYQDGEYPTITKGKEIGSSKLLLDSGTVLFGKLNPRVEKVWRVSSNTSHRKIGSTEWLPLFPREDVSKDFLYFLVWSEHVMPKAKTLVSGSTPSRQRVDARSFYRIEAPLPPLSEQKKIADILGLVRRAIEQNEQQLALTVQLKKTLLHQLFTCGPDNQLQKETEIGAIPKDWKVVPLGEVIGEDPKNGLYKHSSAYGSGTPILRINDFSNDGDVVTSASNRVMTNPSETKLYSLRKDDIVVNRVNSLSHIGKTALIGELPEPMVFESNMMRFRVDEKLALPQYVFRLLNSPICKQQIVGSAKRAVAQSSINQGNIKAILIPLPEIAVQQDISAIIQLVVKKMKLHEFKKLALSDLFHSLLHQLMTAQLRVHDLDLHELESLTGTKL